MNSKNLSTKRISNDIKEIFLNPIEGIGIISLDNDIKKYIVNIMLLTGPYKNYCLQLLLTFPDDYPINPPKVLIYPGQLFDNLYHRHVFNDDSKDEDGLCFRKLCLDLLANDFMSTKNENTGWNPSYTISTLLMQLQIFLSNPDLSINSMPKDYQIKELMESMNNYQRKFIIKNDKGEYNITHTWKDPYPKMYFKSDIEGINKNIIEDNKNKLMKENLTCYILKSNIFDETNIILGYPIIKENDIFYPIPEILSYEGYLTQLSKEEFDRFYISNSLKSANNKYYHAWLPIYINNNNFQLNKQTILNSFSIVKFGISGEKNYDFKPEYIYEVLLKLINKMICDINKNKISSSYLICFFQYILLFKRLSEIYTTNMDEIYFNNNLSQFELYSYVQDLLSLSLLNGFALIESQLNKAKEKLRNKLAIHYFFKYDKCILKSPTKFYEHLKENNLLSSFIETMRYERNLFLYNGKKIKDKIIKIIIYSFKEFVINCDENTKNKMKKVLIDNINFFEFVDYEQFLNLKIDKELEKELNDIFNNLVILLFLKRKISENNENNFFNKLEANYGVYLEVDETIKQLNEIINNKTNYYNKEVEYKDKSICDKIKNNIKELFILIYNSKLEGVILEKIQSIYSKYDFIEIFEHVISIHDLPTFHIFRCCKRYISDYKKSSEPFLFNKIENMNLYNLRLLYLYTYERLKKRINPQNKNLSLIESIFIEKKIKNEKYEWSNYIIEKEKYEYENGEKFDDTNDMIEQRKIIYLFNKAKTINEKLLLDKEEFELNLEEDDDKFLENAIFKNIIKFTEIISDEKKFNEKVFNKISHIRRRRGRRKRNNESNYYVDLDESLIKKLKEIYDKRDITLLTFYEFIWFEEHYDIFNGFLSSLRNHILYNFRMKDSIKEIRQKINIKNIKRNGKEKIANKKYYNNIIKKELSKQCNNLRKKKIIVRNTFMYFKTKNKQYSFRYKY